MRKTPEISNAFGFQSSFVQLQCRVFLLRGSRVSKDWSATVSAANAKASADACAPVRDLARENCQPGESFEINSDSIGRSRASRASVRARLARFFSD